MTTTTPTQIPLVTSPVRNHDAGAPIGGPSGDLGGDQLTAELQTWSTPSRPPYVRVRGGPIAGESRLASLDVMYSWLPENVALQTDVSAASWVVEGLRPWGITYPQPVACFLPDAFEAYAQVFTLDVSTDGRTTDRSSSAGHAGRSWVRDVA